MSSCDHYLNYDLPIFSLERRLFAMGLVCPELKLLAFGGLSLVNGLRWSEYSSKIFGRIACKILKEICKIISAHKRGLFEVNKSKHIDLQKL